MPDNDPNIDERIIDSLDDLLYASERLMVHVAYCTAHYPGRAPCQMPHAHAIPWARKIAIRVAIRKIVDDLAARYLPRGG